MCGGVDRSSGTLRSQYWLTDVFCPQHETASVQMFDHLVKVNQLEAVMEHHGLRLPDDLIFIKEQIAGPLNDSVLDRSVC